MRFQALPLLFALAQAQPSYGGCTIFPAGMAWNVRIDSLPVHPSSSQYISTIGAHNVHLDLGTTINQSDPNYYGIPWNQATAADPWVPITFDPNGNYHDESDCATGNAPPYVINSPCGACGSPALTGVKLPIPAKAQVEGGIQVGPNNGDHHLLIVDVDNCSLWEVYQTYKNVTSGWVTPGGIARWNLRSGNLRPKGWTSSDAAGLPVMPLLLRADEATAVGSIQHAVRFTLQGSQIQGGKTVYEWPASHNTGSGSTSAPMMGQRFRLKANFTIPTTWSIQSQSIATAFKQYGIILADIGSAMFIQGEPSANWDSAIFNSEVQTISVSNFEAVDISSWKSANGFDVNSGLVPGVSSAPTSASSAPTPAAQKGAQTSGATQVALSLIVMLASMLLSALV